MLLTADNLQAEIAKKVEMKNITALFDGVFNNMITAAMSHAGGSSMGPAARTIKSAVVDTHPHPAGLLGKLPGAGGAAQHFMQSQIADMTNLLGSGDLASMLTLLAQIRSEPSTVTLDITNATFIPNAGQGLGFGGIMGKFPFGGQGVNPTSGGAGILGGGFLAGKAQPGSLAEAMLSRPNAMQNLKQLSTKLQSVMNTMAAGNSGMGLLMG